ncbi:hypothetical protein [Lacimonas salitolerans]|uniref:Dihydroxy-acid dehydratase n=1 Tax=Lacimonas salitolerans TaxID=1323750 RepID=A0ABW4EK56_9RHOB
MRVPARIAACLCAVFALAACLDTTGGQTAGEGGRAVPVARQVTMGDGAVIVVPPAGYCIDDSSITSRASGEFALIASCESLTGRLSTVSVEPAVITVTVSNPREGREQPQADLLSGAVPQGVALIATNGEGLSIVQVEGDDGALPGARGDRKHWRGAMVINDRLVGLALYGAPGSTVSGPEGERLLEALAKEIRDHSPLMQRRTAQDAAPTPDMPDAARRQPSRGLLGLLFP